jgi:hypothetical protein
MVSDMWGKRSAIDGGDVVLVRNVLIKCKKWLEDLGREAFADQVVGKCA